MAFVPEEGVANPVALNEAGAESIASPEDPLVESVPLAREAAATYCLAIPHLETNCAWYHGFWLYMRAMGIGKASGGQSEFLVSTLRELARSGESPRVLITGTADYSMPSHALWAYQQERVSQELTVMDVCETPLFLTRWYAERQGVSVATACSDVLEYEPDMTFDVAMTNSFLGSFAPDRRPALFASWARVLRPGGKLLFTNRIRPDAEGISRFGPEEIEAFCQTVERGATNLPPQLGADIDWIASSARTYAERYFSYPVTSTEEIVQLLEAAGFYVDRLQVAHHGGRPGGPVSGPTTNQSADYARVLATRL